VLLSVLLRQEQGLNHTKNQEIKGHLNSRSNTEIRKLDQNVARKSECSSRDQKVVLNKPRISRTLIQVMQGTCDMDICPEKYICMNQATKASMVIKGSMDFDSSWYLCILE
jgi:hypothetical protein